jgi:hypothetical protein
MRRQPGMSVDQSITANQRRASPAFLRAHKLQTADFGIMTATLNYSPPEMLQQFISS